MPCVRKLFKGAKMFGMPLKGEIDYSVDIDLDSPRCSQASPDPNGHRTGSIAGSWKNVSRVARKAGS
jgi:hypothetical protein